MCIITIIINSKPNVCHCSRFGNACGLCRESFFSSGIDRPASKLYSVSSDRLFNDTRKDLIRYVAHRALTRRATADLRSMLQQSMRLFTTYYNVLLLHTLLAVKTIIIFIFVGPVMSMTSFRLLDHKELASVHNPN